MVILSSRISTTDDLTAFVHAVDSVSERLQGDSAVPLILHPVGLPGVSASTTDATESMARLREIVARPAVHVWNGGYAGASGIHLTAEELAWDLTWARTNPWNSGLSRLLEVSPTVDFPVLLTATQARQLGEEHMAHQGPLCLGYVGYTPAAPPSGTRRLWFMEDGRWKWLNSHVVADAEGIEPQVEAPDGPVSCLHIILSGEARSISVTSPPTGELSALRQDDSRPPGTFFHSAVERDGRWLTPRRAAAVADIRSSRAVSRDRTAAVLRAAAGLLAPDAVVRAAKDGHDPFRNRELQGGVTGNLRLETDSVGALFSAGRIAGLTYGQAPLTPTVRAQGFLQTEATTRYLDTVSAAWFTGLRVRGVHEVAQIPGHVRLGVTTFAMDRLPGLVLNVTGDGPMTAEEAVVRHGALEVPLYDLGDSAAELTGAVLDSSGRIRELTVFPHLTDTLSTGDSPLEWSVGAVGLRVDLPAASLWMIAAHPGAALPVPFALGARKVSGGFRISWYPAGFERNAVPSVSFCRRWSVSYRILAVDRKSDAAVSTRVEQDLVEEIDGFTCQEDSAGRSVPAT